MAWSASFCERHVSYRRHHAVEPSSIWSCIETCCAFFGLACVVAPANPFFHTCDWILDVPWLVTLFIKLDEKSVSRRNSCMNSEKWKLRWFMYCGCMNLSRRRKQINNAYWYSQFLYVLFKSQTMSFSKKAMGRCWIIGLFSRRLGIYPQGQQLASSKACLIATLSLVRYFIEVTSLWNSCSRSFAFWGKLPLGSRECFTNMLHWPCIFLLKNRSYE